MDWVLIIGVGLFCALIGSIWGGKVATESAAIEVRQLKMRLSADQRAYFAKVRQAIGNELVIRDPDSYTRLYARIHENLENLRKNSDAANRAARIKIISDKYCQITDFDPFQTRDYVLFSDAAASWSTDDLQQIYSDLLEYWMLREFDEYAPWQTPTTDDELKHVKRYMKQVKDSQTWHRIANAAREYKNFSGYVQTLFGVDGFWEVWREAREKTYGRASQYETPDFTVQYATDIAGTAEGYYFKEDGLCAKTTFLSAEANEFYVNIYKSDSSFEKEIELDRLVLDHIAVPFHFMPKDALGYRRVKST